MKHLGMICLLTISVSACKGSIAHEIKTGAAIGAATCEWIEESTVSGAILAICATLEEIAKWGRHPAKILRARGQQLPRDEDFEE